MIYAFSLYPKQAAANPLELESRLLEDAPRSHILDRCHRLDALKTAARTTENLVPYILDCARAYATLYEIRAAMEEVFGAYREPVFF